MRRFPFIAVLLLTFSLFGQTAQSQDLDGSKFVKVKLIANVTTVQPGGGDSSFKPKIGVLFRISPGWHIYWKNSGEAALPTEVKWKIPAGWQVGELQWPMPFRFVERGNIKTYGYRDEVLLFADLPNPDFLPDNDEQVTIGAQVHWLVCKDICVPGSTTLSLSLPFSSTLPLAPSESFSLFEKYERLLPAANFKEADIPEAPASFHVVDRSAGSPTLLLILGSAFLAGLLLNLMPCVLPVLSIKILSLIEQGGHTKSFAFKSAAACTAGVLVSFLSLAFAVISLKNLGHSIGWGFQFQYPGFVAVLAIVVFVLSLSFFDLFAFSIPKLQSANQSVAQIRNHYLQQFFDGILVTALSTPCTAPFLGTALAFAFTESSFEIILVFLTIGLGLASPYFLFSLNDSLLNLLPKPGNWMYRFRELMGFLLLGTVVWLLFVLSKLSQDGVIWILGILLLLFAAFWFWRALSNSFHRTATRKIFGAFLFSVCVFAFYRAWPHIVTKHSASSVTATKRIPWQPYSAELVAKLQTEKKPVLIDFTADWCITCKANEFLVIETDEVARTIKELGIVPVRADWTTGSQEIMDALQSYGANGVPLYVVSGGELSEPVILPTVLTKNILLDALLRVR